VYYLLVGGGARYTVVADKISTVGETPIPTISPHESQNSIDSSSIVPQYLG
jgi:hypothetical protein